MPNRDESFDPKLVWVVQIASAFSLGTLAALIYSISSINPQIEFHISGSTLVAFILAALASLFYWHLAFRLSSGEKGVALEQQINSRSSRRRWLILLSWAFGLAMVIAFAYPLKGFSREKVSEIGKGTLLAVAFLTVLGVLFWRVVRFLEHGEPNETKP